MKKESAYNGNPSYVDPSHYINYSLGKIKPWHDSERIVGNLNNGASKLPEVITSLEVKEKARRLSRKDNELRNTLFGSLGQGLLSTLSKNDYFAPIKGSMLGSIGNSLVPSSQKDFTHDAVAEIAKGDSVRGIGKYLLHRDHLSKVDPSISRKLSQDDLNKAFQPSHHDTVHLFDTMFSLASNDEKVELSRILDDHYGGDISAYMDDYIKNNDKGNDLLEKIKGSGKRLETIPFKHKYDISPEKEKQLMKLTDADNPERLKKTLPTFLGQMAGGSVGQIVAKVLSNTLSRDPVIKNNRFIVGAGAAVGGALGRILHRNYNEKIDTSNDEKIKQVLET